MSNDTIDQKIKGFGYPITLDNNNIKNGFFYIEENWLNNLKNKIRHLLLLSKGEIVNQPNMGCDLYKLLFNQANIDTIKEYVTKNLNEQIQLYLYDYNIEILEVNVESDSDSKYKITIKFFVNSDIIKNKQYPSSQLNIEDNIETDIFYININN